MKKKGVETNHQPVVKWNHPFWTAVNKWWCWANVTKKKTYNKPQERPKLWRQQFVKPNAQPKVAKGLQFKKCFNIYTTLGFLKKISCHLVSNQFCLMSINLTTLKMFFFRRLPLITWCFSLKLLIFLWLGSIPNPPQNSGSFEACLDVTNINTSEKEYSWQLYPGTQNNHFQMDVWWHTHFGKDISSTRITFCWCCNVCWLWYWELAPKNTIRILKIVGPSLKKRIWNSMISLRRCSPAKDVKAYVCA